MNSIYKNLLFIILISLTYQACNVVDKYGEYKILNKLDDDTIHILKIKNDPTDYIFNSRINLDIRSLKTYNQFFVDKNQAYCKYETSDETWILRLDNVDINSFKVINNSIYSKDKNHVFDSRNEIIEHADPETFKSININHRSRVATGMDKNNYYFWNDILQDTIGFGNLLKK